MRTFGVFLLIISIFIAIYALQMDIAIDTAYGRINNIGLMANRQTYLIIAGTLFLGSLIMITLGKSKVNSDDIKKCPFCAEEIKKEAIKCKHCGADILSEKKREPSLNPDDKSQDIKSIC